MVANWSGVIAELRSKALTHGVVIPEHLIADGRWHRFDAAGGNASSMLMTRVEQLPAVRRLLEQIRRWQPAEKSARTTSEHLWMTCYAGLRSLRRAARSEGQTRGPQGLCKGRNKTAQERSCIVGRSFLLEPGAQRDR
jgi:hypothetical protein